MSGSAAARVDAQAKLNLALRVLSRDSSGYHPIETLFLRIDLADSVMVRPTSGARLVTSNASLGTPESNLAFLAAERYSAATGWPAGWEIQIEKRIPVGAGLGGGSADAAAVLRALNMLSPNPVTSDELQKIAATIGADVAFLTSDSVFAFAEGYGEKLTDLKPLPQMTVGLAVPGFGVSTREAYGWVDTDSAANPDRPRWDLQNLSWSSLRGAVENDFSGVVGRRHADIGKLTEWFLARGAVTAGMTGSGSVVFGVFEEMPPMSGLPLPVAGNLLWTTTASRVVEPQPMG